MTIGVAVQDNEGNWLLACDTLSSQGGIKYKEDKYYIGDVINAIFAGDVGLCNFVRNNLREFDDKLKDKTINVYELMKKIKELAEEHGYNWREDCTEIILVVRCKAYYIYNGMVINMIGDHEIQTIGSGGECALGILTYLKYYSSTRITKHTLETVIATCGEIYTHCNKDATVLKVKEYPIK